MFQPRLYLQLFAGLVSFKYLSVNVWMVIYFISIFVRQEILVNISKIL